MSTGPGLQVVAPMAKDSRTIFLTLQSQTRKVEGAVADRASLIQLYRATFQDETSADDDISFVTEDPEFKINYSITHFRALPHFAAIEVHIRSPASMTEDHKRGPTMVTCYCSKQLRWSRQELSAVQSAFRFDELVGVSHLDCAGLESQVSQLYVRHEGVALWKFLQECVAKKFHDLIPLVSGSSGSGKSTTAWAWACYRASVHHDRVVWAHVGVPSSHIVILHGRSLLHVSFCSKEELANWLRRYHHPSSAFLIIDGVTSANQMDLLLLAGYWHQLSSSSLAIVVASEPLKTGQRLIFQHFELLSWSVEQFHRAWQIGLRGKLSASDVDWTLVPDSSHDHDPVDPRPVSILHEEKEKPDASPVMTKFFISGGCARLMFGKSHAEAEAFLEEGLADRQIGARLLHLLFGSVDSGVHAFRGKHGVADYWGGHYFIISRYAAVLLADKCSADFIMQALHVARRLRNPMFRGWILELDFYYQLGRDVCVFEQKDGSGLGQVWKLSGRPVKFATLDDLQFSLLQDGEWWRPSKRPHGSFDAFQVQLSGSQSELRLRFVQFAVGDKKLAIRWAYVTQVLRVFQTQGIEVSAVEWVVVAHINGGHDVRLDQCEEEGQDSLYLQGKQMSKRVVYFWQTLRC